MRPSIAVPLAALFLTSCGSASSRNGAGGNASGGSVPDFGSGGMSPTPSGSGGVTGQTNHGGSGGVLAGSGTGGATGAGAEGSGGLSGDDAGNIGVDAGVDVSVTGGGGAGGLAGGGASTGGRGTGGTSGTAGRAGGGGGASGGTTVGGGGVSGAAGPFTCTLLVGPSTMGQWFNGGFLTYPGIDPTTWELIMVAHHYTNAWAMPGDSAWDTQVSHPCARSSGAPDRVAFMATQWTEKTAAEWEADFAGIVKNIQIHWPMVKRIELMPSPCAPGNQLCAAQGVASTETIIPAYGYEAIDAMPAKYPGLVYSTPHFEVPKCSDFIGNGTAPQYAPDAAATTGPAVMDVANVFGAYYAAHP